MTQQPLFSVRVQTLIPNTTGSADLRFFAIGEDGHEYAVKEVLPGNLELPAAEYLGYCLSASCQVAVPTTVRLEMPDGSMALGSRFEGGVSTYNILAPGDKLTALTQCAPTLSALLTLDAFLANDDRHVGNFLLRKGALQGSYSLIAIDFSRALWKSGFPATTPSATVASGNTATTILFLKTLNLWDNAGATRAATAITAVPSTMYDAWVNGMPTGWVTPSVTASVTWWATTDKEQRVQDTLGAIV